MARIFPPGFLTLFLDSMNILKKYLLLQFLELVFFCPAFRTEPVIRQILERGSRTDPVIRVPGCRVIDISADQTLPFLHPLFPPYLCLINQATTGILPEFNPP